MIHVILQNVVFPKYGVCSVHDLYFRLDNHANYSFSNQSINLNDGENAYFDTYFNGFYLNKWKKYTNVGEILLTLKLKGKFRITLLHKERFVNRECKNTILGGMEFSSETEKSVTLSFGDFTFGMFAFELLSLRDNSVIYGGYYSSDVLPNLINDIKIGLCICTFKRERYVISNINHVLKSFLENKDSVLFNRLEVFISDNDGTLNPQVFENPAVHIFNNKNVGGAGGFTRCLIEVQKNNSGITHTILMDDDIIFDTESIFRTFTLLSTLKEEYEDAFIGGAMLSLDRQNIQVESGARWNKGDVISLKSGLNLIFCESCLYNDIEETTDYNAWWYCATPIKKVNENGLPLPLFFRGDDAEYGLRNIKNIILMNGICVWHEPFENKYSSTTFYYIFRNRLINNSVHGIDYGKKQLIKDFLKQWNSEMTRFRYKNANLLVKGVEDFLKGIDWFRSVDGEDLHKEIISLGYRLDPVSEINVGFLYSEFDRLLHSDARPIDWKLNLLLPAKRNATIQTYNPPDQLFNRAKVIVNYDYPSGKAFVTSKNFRLALGELKKALVLIKRIDKDYDNIKAQYENRGNEIMTLSFWNDYLGLKEQQ
ncbi:MAG: hypothetical protein ACOX10_05040 [Candidatus Methanomethylophilaceae archaeon]